MTHNIRIFGALAPVSKETMTIIVGVILTFMLINFNEKLGLVFLSIVFLDAIIMLFGKGINFFGPEQDTTRLIDVVGGVFGYAVFIIIGAVLASILVGGPALTQPLQAVFMKLQSTQPILEGNQILTFIGWGILIPIVETGFFFGRLLQWVGYKFGVSQLRFSDIKTWAVFVFISAAFTLFHLTARAIAVTGSGVVFDNLALVLTFVFGMISCILVVYFKELSAATYTHITSNSLAVAGTMGYKVTQALLGI